MAAKQSFLQKTTDNLQTTYRTSKKIWGVFQSNISHFIFKQSNLVELCCRSVVFLGLQFTKRFQRMPIRFRPIFLQLQKCSCKHKTKRLLHWLVLLWTLIRNTSHQPQSNLEIDKLLQQFPTLYYHAPASDQWCSSCSS